MSPPKWRQRQEDHGHIVQACKWEKHANTSRTLKNNYHLLDVYNNPGAMLNALPT